LAYLASTRRVLSAQDEVVKAISKVVRALPRLRLEVIDPRDYVPDPPQDVICAGWAAAIRRRTR
jgi:hypothetical protein